MYKKNVQAVLNIALVSLYFLCLFSVGMYEAGKITFIQCTHDMIVYLLFGVINWLAKRFVRNVSIEMQV